MDRAQLCDILMTYFGPRDLTALCFNLKINYKELPGKLRLDKVHGLIELVEQRDLVPQLLEEIRKARPNIPPEELDKVLQRDTHVGGALPRPDEKPGQAPKAKVLPWVGMALVALVGVALIVRLVLPALRSGPACLSARPYLKDTGQFGGQASIDTLANCQTGLAAGTEILLGGSYSDLPEDAYTWVLVYSPNGGYYPQAHVNGQCDPQLLTWSNGKWKGVGYLGSPDGTPEEFDIIVAFVDKATSDTWAGWVKKGCEDRNYPGISASVLASQKLTEKASITVQTKD